jgi:hypothetical protein
MGKSSGSNLHEVDEMISYMPNARWSFFKEENKKVDFARQKLVENDKEHRERLEAIKGQPVLKFDEKVEKVIES